MTKKIIALLVCMALFFSGCTNSAALAQSEKSTEQSQTGETLYGKIKEINGNEMLLVLGSYQTATTGGQSPAGGNVSPSPSTSAAESAPDTSQRARTEEDISQTNPANPNNQTGGDQSAARVPPSTSAAESAPDTSQRARTGEDSSQTNPANPNDQTAGDQSAAMPPSASAAESAPDTSQRARTGEDISQTNPANPNNQTGGDQSAAMPPSASASEQTQTTQQEQTSSSGAASGTRRQGGTGANRAGASAGNFTSSGGEETYLIPVTTTVTTGQGDNAREIRFTQLAVKNIVCLHLDEKGTIISIEVLG